MEKQNQKGNKSKIPVLILLGQTRAGKTSLIRRFVEDQYEDKFLTTLGVDFYKKDVSLSDKLKVPATIWDTGGQERYKSIAKSYYDKANGILLVYDVTDRKSFDEIEHWMEQIFENAVNTSIKMLVAAKCDLENISVNVVNEEEGKKLAEKYKIKFMKTSAKKGIGVNEAFKEIIQDIWRQSFQSEDSKIITSLESQPKQRKKSKCC